MTDDVDVAGSAAGEGGAPVRRLARAGVGEVAAALVDGASAIVACAARNPLKLLVSRERGPCARVHLATFGGGLLAGDEVSLEVRVGAGATLAVGTSAPGKVYRCDDGRASTQRTRVVVAPEGLVALVPGPLTCYQGARYHQRTDVEIEAGGSLLLVETLTCGRSARGERWVAERYDARTRITLETELVLHEALRLEDGVVPVASRLGRANAIAFAVLLGPRLVQAAQAAADHIDAMSALRGAQVRLSASATPFGLVVRGAADDAEALADALRGVLAPALAVVSGGDAWHEPW